MFPDGYEMKARSLDFDREGQKKILGHVAIEDTAKAFEFLGLINDEEPLLTAVRKARETGKPDSLSERKGFRTIRGNGPGGFARCSSTNESLSRKPHRPSRRVLCEHRIRQSTPDRCSQSTLQRPSETVSEPIEPMGGIAGEVGSSWSASFRPRPADAPQLPEQVNLAAVAGLVRAAHERSRGARSRRGWWADGRSR